MIASGARPTDFVRIQNTLLSDVYLIAGVSSNLHNGSSYSSSQSNVISFMNLRQLQQVLVKAESLVLQGINIIYKADIILFFA